MHPTSDSRLEARPGDPSATTTATASFWLESAPADHHPALQGEIPADVAVLGGGIAGVTTALRLQRAGARTVLLEARTIGSGVTGANTAKASALQATMLRTIARHHGAEAAAIYAQATAAAVEDIAELSSELKLDCQLERRSAVTYAPSAAALDTVRGEFEAALAAGLPVRWSDEDAGLPYPVAGAVWLDHQLAFHPVRYVRGLARAFVAAGGRVFEFTRALSVNDGDPCQVRTERGSVRAGQVVVATHYPTLDRGLFFARLEAQRSYCIAVRIADAPPRAMAISAGSDQTRSVQSMGDVLIVGGEGHSAGASGITDERFARLEDFAAAYWDAGESRGRWSAQDPIPYDHLPMVGPLLPRTRRLWVATGWAKWGLTGGTFAGRILADSLLGQDNPWADRFSPNRLSLRSIPEVAKLGAKFNGLLALDRITPAQARSADEVPPGEARVVRDGLGKAGVYRDLDGGLHAVSLRCTHLGCLLRFNGAERSWDCPCHGSRFGVDGEVLEGPAVHPLRQREV
jgi:glycine/D-amino acid oxidase-like deaminating enzyme/nitrite reductase/ring-hydroxylating ferredoxin subunit